MPGQAKQSATPSAFILAFAIAVFLHVILFAVARQWPEATRQPPETVVMRLNLVDSGRTSAPTETPSIPKPTTPSSLQQLTTQGLSDFSVAEPETRPAPIKQPPTVSDETPDRPRIPPIQPRPTVQPQTSAPSTTTSSPTPGVTTAGITAQGEENELTPYEQELMTLIATAYYDLRGRKYSGNPTPRAVKLELLILGNGALIQTKTLKSSGDRLFDERAKQATFRASPFPATPDGKRLRQEVTLKLNPPDN